MKKQNIQYYKFCLYGFLKNLRFFDAFLLLFFKSTGLSFFQIGCLYSIREIATFVLEIPTGILADIFGKKRAMVLSLSCYLISFILFYSFSGFVFFALAMMLYAFGEAFRTGTHKSIILDYLETNNIKDQKGKYYSSVRTWAQSGLAVSTVLSGILIYKFNKYNIIFLAAIFPYMLNFINVLSYQTKSRKRITATGDKIRLSQRISEYKEIILATFKNKQFKNALYNSVIYDSSFKAVKDYIQPLLSLYAISLPILAEGLKSEAIVVTTVYVILYTISALSSKRSAHLMKKSFSINYLLNWTMITTTILYITCGLTITLNILPLAIIAFVGTYIMYNIRRPVMICHFTDNTPVEISATALSVESQLRSILTASIAPILGVGVDHYGLGITFIIFAVILAILSFGIGIRK